MHTTTRYILSALSEQTLCLADSITDADPVITFTNTSVDDPRFRYLIDRCNEKGYSLTDRDINAVIASLEPVKERIVVMLADTEDTNLANSIRLSRRYGGDENLSIYCFASSHESEYIIDGLNIENFRSHLHPMKLRRVLPVRRSIYRYLYENSLFDRAVTINDEKWINFVIVGLNGYGMEMLRAVLWFAQMDGYYLRVDIFDKDTEAEERFSHLCPGITERGTLPRLGEDYYDIKFHCGINPYSSRLNDTLTLLPETTHVFIDTGNDRDNIDLALSLRSFYSGLYMDKGIFVSHAADSLQSPVIAAVTADDAKASLFRENAVKNYKDQYFRIECIGCCSDVYNTDSIINDPVESQALSLHLSALDRASFEMHEYYRRSSTASAIHQKYRKALVPDESAMAVTEHRRWCAYMRSTEGYRYGTSRDDLAKRHPSLTPYAGLNMIEQEKDRRINRNAADPSFQDS